MIISILSTYKQLLSTITYLQQDAVEAEQFSYFVKVALVEAIERHCKCHFPITNVLDELFSCEDSPNMMSYQNTLFGTHNFNGTQIIGFIQEWVSTSPRIRMERSQVRVDSSCPVAISSLDEPGCGQNEGCLTYDDDPHSFTMYAKHLDNQNIANCFERCTIRNG